MGPVSKARLNRSSAAPSKVKPEDEMRSRAKCKPDFRNALTYVWALTQVYKSMATLRDFMLFIKPALKGIMLCSWGEGGNTTRY
jgi:hypothetical protein